jgi:hypothetical protein
MLYINRLGGRVESLRNVTKRIWDFCQSRNLEVSAQYINTLDNKIADTLSRKFSNQNIELTLRTQIFTALQKTFGPLEIDCFATMQNHKLPAYMALRIRSRYRRTSSLGKPQTSASIVSHRSTSSSDC